MKKLGILLLAVLLVSLLPVCYAEEAPIVLEPGQYTGGIEIPAGEYIAEINSPSGFSVASVFVRPADRSSVGNSEVLSSSKTSALLMIKENDIVQITGLALKFTKTSAEEVFFQQRDYELSRILTDEEKTIALILDSVPEVNQIAIASEENDPWNGLHKKGQYQALVFFSHVDLGGSEIGSDLVALGNRAGGCVEFYETVDAAKNRDAYLASFDGNTGILDPGSHTVYNTLVIRTSPTLTATQQKNTEADIIAAFTSYDNGTLPINLDDYYNIVISQIDKAQASKEQVQDVGDSQPVPAQEPVMGLNTDFAIGETWIVDGQWELTVTGASMSLDRNPYSDKNPQATYIVDFTYRNIGYENDFLDGLIFSMSDTIVDSAGRMGYSYPNSVVRYPQMVPVGAICDAQVCIGVDNAGPFRITVSQYDGNKVKQQATFIVDEFSGQDTDQALDSAQMPLPTSSPLPAAPFDHAALLGDKEGYSYDKFDQKWIWFSTFKKYWSDATFVLGLQAFGEDHGPNLSELVLYTRFLDKQGDKFATIKALDFLIDGVTYSYKTMIEGKTDSQVTIGANGNLFVEALAFCDANNVSLRITTDKDVYTLDLDPTELTWTLKDFCRTYLQTSLWSYCVDHDYVEKYENTYPLTVNGVLADYTTMHQDRDLSQLDATFTVPKPTQTPAPTPTPTSTPVPTPTAISDVTSSSIPTQTPTPTPKETYIFNVADKKTNMKVGEINKDDSFYVGLSAVRATNVLYTALDWHTIDIPSGQEVVYVLLEVYNDSGKIKNYSSSKVSVYADSNKAADPDSYSLVGIDGYQAYNSNEIDPGMKLLLVDAYLVPIGWKELTVFADDLSWTLTQQDVLRTPYSYTTLFPVNIPSELTQYSYGDVIYSKDYTITYDNSVTHTHNNVITGNEYYLVFEFTINNTSNETLDYDFVGYNMRAYQDLRLLSDATYTMDDNIEGHTNIFDVDEIKPGMSAKVYVAFKLPKPGGFYVCAYDTGYMGNKLLAYVSASGG